MRKMFQIVIDDRQEDWINKSVKAMGVETKAEFGRVLLNFVMENDPKELKDRITKTRLNALIQDAQRREEEARREREQAEKQLEKVSA